jgi:hypothetical protein
MKMHRRNQADVPNRCDLNQAFKQSKGLCAYWSPTASTIVNTTRKVRNRIAAVTSAIPFAAFSTFMWLFFSYFSSHPKVPHPDLGLVHRLSNHGSYVYISDSEATGMSLLVLAFLIGAGLTIVIAPKEFMLPPAETPRWLTYVSASAKMDSWSANTIILQLGFILIWLAVIWTGGPRIVDFVTSHGVVLDFGL